jgi:endonuclease G, mitochondrial
VIWGNDASDDHFVQSHGVATPDAFRKLIVRGQDRVIAWVIPNTSQATRSRLDEYLVTVDEFAQRTGETFPEAAESARSENALFGFQGRGI